MLSEDIVLSLLEASITGAGLVLTVYALIVPLSKRLMRNALSDFIDIVRDYNNTVNKVLKLNDKKILDKARHYGLGIIESWTYPTYLRFGVGATFFGYTFDILASLAWIADWQKSLIDSILIPTFALSTIIFLMIGLFSIKDVHKTMKEDYNQIIKSLRDNEPSDKL